MKSFAVLALAVVHIAWAHYEKPPCAADEQLFQISGAEGYVCAPPCPNFKCPSDVPKSVTAKAVCAASETGKHFCVLECTSDAECDQDGGATCDLVQPPIGVCMYKKQLDSVNLPQLTYSAVPAGVVI